MPPILDGTADFYGEPERETPDWPVRIGTAVVFLGCVYCALRAAGAF